MRAVLDANVVAAGVLWDGEGWMLFVKLARRRFRCWGSNATLDETRAVCLRLIQERKPRHHAAARLNWYLDQMHLAAPAPLGKPRSRDPRDDPYLAAALGSRAEAIVSYDHDLLAFEKPFGVAVLSPAQFLKRLHELM